MVELREITKDNYEECLKLTVADNQKNFVSSTVLSLAQAWVYYDTAFPFAIYARLRRIFRPRRNSLSLLPEEFLKAKGGCLLPALQQDFCF